MNLEHSGNREPNIVNGRHGTVDFGRIHFGHDQTRLAKRIFAIANLLDIGFPISIGIDVVVLLAFFDNDEGLVGQRRACHADGLWVGCGGWGT